MQRPDRCAADTFCSSVLLAALACSNSDASGQAQRDALLPAAGAGANPAAGNALGGNGPNPTAGTDGSAQEGVGVLPIANGPPLASGGASGLSGTAEPPGRVLAAPNGFARNPIVSHIFTADPSAHVFEGRVYVYTSHDLDTQMGYDMNDYHAFSSADLVNWQDHGVVLAAADVSWANKLYAPSAAYSAVTGKYYLYFPNEGSAIGVAVSDSPAGPFVDALGRPLIDPNVPGAGDVDWLFDPTVFIDDDGQVYLYFGGGPEGTGDNARVIRLQPDMLSLADAAATTIPVPDFFEASYVHKRQGRYYYSYSTSFANHEPFIDYLVSDNPMTGWQYAGTVLPQPAGNNGNNNHHSFVDYQGSSYIFYHNRVLANRDGFSSFQRSITLDYLTYDAQGNINQVPAQQGRVLQLRSVDAFSRIEAEAMADQRGLETRLALDAGTRVGVSLTEIQNGDWVGYSQVDFGDGAGSFRARVSGAAGGAIEVRVDGCNEFTQAPGVLAGSCTVLASGATPSWTDVECSVAVSAGTHDLCLSFAGPVDAPLFELDYFSFQ